MSTTVDFDSAQDLPALYRLLDEVQVKNGWAKAKPAIVPEPRHPFVPHRWRYEDMRAALEVAGRLVDTQWAERRNLIMANPFPGNDYATVPTLVGAYQLVKTGERARSHRHTPNAMRVVLEAGADTFTTVDGVKIPMAPGDVLLTPNGCWHGHSNESDVDAYWIDVLDAPLTIAMGPVFFQHHPELVESATRVDSGSPMRFAFEDYASRLADAPEIAEGVCQYVLGPATLVTFDRVAMSLAAGAQWEHGRCSASQIYTVVQGSGRSRIGDRDFDWRRGDMIAAPSWQEQRHQADEDAILLRVSDEPLMRMLSWYVTGEPFGA
jgi:gentisate 1,2-dioxygenase